LRREPVKKIIDAKNDRAVRQQALTEVRTEETGTPRNQHARFNMHMSLPPDRPERTTAIRDRRNSA